MSSTLTPGTEAPSKVAVARWSELSDGKGRNLICGLHNWDFRADTGVSEYDNNERLAKFSAWGTTGRPPPWASRAPSCPAGTRSSS